MKYTLLLLLAVWLACGQPSTPQGESSPAAQDSRGMPSASTAQETGASAGASSTGAAGTMRSPQVNAPESAGSQAGNGPKASLTATYWRVISLNGQPVTGKTAKEMFLLLDPSSPQFKSHSGCNTIMGETKRGNANQLRFTNLISTTMDCRTPEIETEFNTALEGIRTFAIQGRMLVLNLENGKAGMTLEAK